MTPHTPGTRRMLEMVTPADCDFFTRPWAKEDKECANLLGQVRMHAWRGAKVFVLEQEGEPGSWKPVHLHVGHFATNRRGLWGRYYNFLVAYTPPALRRNGLAREALDRRVRELKPDRLKSLAGSKYGVLLHLGLDHQFWGMNLKGEFIIDTPLKPGSREGAPFHGRSAYAHANKSPEQLDLARPMTATEIAVAYRSKYGENAPETTLAQYMHNG